MKKNKTQKENVKCKKEEVCDNVEFYGFIKIRQRLEDEYRSVPFCICYECGRLGSCEDEDLFVKPTEGVIYDMS